MQITKRLYVASRNNTKFTKLITNNEIKNEKEVEIFFAVGKKLKKKFALYPKKIHLTISQCFNETERQITYFKIFYKELKGFPFYV